MQLQGCVFAEADLSSADLSNCNIERVEFFAAKLARANLSGTTGFEARQLRSLSPDLQGIKFAGLDLSNSMAPIKADLMKADFTGCVMHCVQLTGLMPLQQTYLLQLTTFCHDRRASLRVELHGSRPHVRCATV